MGTTGVPVIVGILVIGLEGWPIGAIASANIAFAAS